MDIGQAIKAMQEGERVARPAWNGAGMWLAIERPSPGSTMRKPFIFISPVDGECVPWLASQTDLLATDWRVIEPADVARRD